MTARTLIAVGALALLNACAEPDPKESPQYKQLAEDNTRTEALVAEKDSTINALFGTFNRINENLQTIRSKQGGLSTPSGGVEQGGDMEERIMGDLASIDELLAENRTLIEKLRKQAKSSAAGIAELERTVADLEQGMARKDLEIDSLKEQLSSTSSSLATLIDMYRDKSQLSDMQRNALNTAYYTVGTLKELRANGVLTKEGGVAGIGGTSKLNMESLPKDAFKQIDVTNSLEIPILAKKARVATSHPAGSYKLEEGADKLIITDPNTFWSVSKYLVIVVE